MLEALQYLQRPADLLQLRPDRWVHRDLLLQLQPLRVRAAGEEVPGLSLDPRRPGHLQGHQLRASHPHP